MRRPEATPVRGNPPPERHLEALWYGSPWPGTLLAPLGWLFGAVVRVRRVAYSRGWLSSARLPVPVIVVGNITVGGTGKTPVVAWLARWLAGAGYRPGIVTRGYGGRVGRGPKLVQAGDDPALVGDEPLLLSRETGVPVCTGSDRVAAGRRLLDLGVDVIISDDGLQHYRLARDLELAVVDGQRRLGNGRLMPAGPLREPAGRLREVDKVLVNGGPPEPGEVTFRVEGQVAVLPDGTGARPLAGFRGLPVRMLAGIGNPGRFRELLTASGLQVVQSLPVGDHGRVPDSLLQAPGPPIFMTGKDAVKYRLPGDGSCWVVPVQAILPADFGQWLAGRLPPPRAGGQDPGTVSPPGPHWARATSGTPKS